MYRRSLNFRNGVVVATKQAECKTLLPTPDYHSEWNHKNRPGVSMKVKRSSHFRPRVIRTTPNLVYGSLALLELQPVGSWWKGCVTKRIFCLLDQTTVRVCHRWVVNGPSRTAEHTQDEAAIHTCTLSHYMYHTAQTKSGPPAFPRSEYSDVCAAVALSKIEYPPN